MWDEHPDEENPSFKLTLVLIALAHLIIIGVLVFFGTQRVQSPTENLVWMNPGSFAGSTAASDLAASNKPAEMAPADSPAEPAEPIDPAPAAVEPSAPISTPVPVREPPSPPPAPPLHPASTPPELAEPVATPKPTPKTTPNPTLKASATPWVETNQTPQPKPPSPKPTPRPTPKEESKPKATPKPTPKTESTPKPRPSPKSAPDSEATPVVAKAKNATPKPEKKEKLIARENKQPTATTHDADSEKKRTAELTSSGATTKQAGTGNGSGSGAAAGTGASDLAYYAEIIKNRFQAAWNQPHGALTAGTQLIATVKLRIEPDGTVTDFTLVDGSGNAVVDESVRQAGHRITKLPPPPGGSTFSPVVRFELGD
jgi:TonB family protein